MVETCCLHELEVLAVQIECWRPRSSWRNTDQNENTATANRGVCPDYARGAFFMRLQKTTEYNSGLSIMPVEQCRVPAILPVKSLGTDGNNQ